MSVAWGCSTPELLLRPSPGVTSAPGFSVSLTDSENHGSIWLAPRTGRGHETETLQSL